MSRLRDLMDELNIRTAANFLLRLGLNAMHLWLGGMAIVWTSVFFYLVFYWMYMPVVTNTREVYVQYDSRCDARAVPAKSCGTPYARAAYGTYDFARGQTYRFGLDLRLPESEVNWDQGMFMVRLVVTDYRGNEVVNVAKATGLMYKSIAVRAIYILFYWPLLLLGWAEESQRISVNLLDNFVEGSYGGSGGPYEVTLQFEARDVQIYPPTTLQVVASLSGLRYFMYHHWIVSFFVGSSSIASLCSTFLFLIYLNHIHKRNQSEDNSEADSGLTGDSLAIEHQRDPDSSGLIGDLEDELEEEKSQQFRSEETEEQSSNESDVSSTVVIEEKEE